MKVTALIYHDVLADHGADDSGFAGADARTYKLTETQFHRHLDLISALPSAVPLRLAERAGEEPSGAALLLTFDDGGASAPTRIMPALRQRSWPAHFFVTTDRIGTPGFMTPQGVRELHGAGHVVGTHSASHPARMSSLPYELMCREWSDSRARLEDLLGTAVTVASVPGGYYSPAVARAAAQAGIGVLFTSEPQRSVRYIDGLTVIGRFSVTRRTSDADIVSLASGSGAAAVRQRLAWDTKKLAKRIGGEAWLTARRRFFELRRR
ncbi:MAG: polysaccharide deacetylase family protein [Gammaproteobacteria bacterium]|nr:polysaccharide deacetylase family protein [Gammaproteobacteria bacterium]